nr:phospho-sugar mutase [Xylanimonas oleitrophica]
MRALVERVTAEGEAARAAVTELRDRFAGTLQFGTAGLRGAMAAGPNRMNRAVVTAAAAGLGTYLRDAVGAEGPAPRVVVGYDARHRSADFARDTAAVMTAQGIEVHVLPRPLPTPVLAFAVRHLEADAGVMVTASHNPAADNGYKVYLGGRVVTDAGQGAQIVPPYDALIAERIAAVGPAAAVERAGSGWQVLGDDVVDAYVAAVGALSDGAARDLRIVTTSLHGVGGPTLARVLAEAGFTDVVPVAEQADPDPDFRTVAFPNPEEKGAIDLALALAQEVDADLVIANDPDADRCAVAVRDRRTGTYQGTETSRSQGWRMLHGDEVGALLGHEVATSGRATGSGATPVLANSVVSSRLLASVAAKHGLAHATTLTGFKWISRTPGLVFGYEEALGYCVDPASVRDKDGISAALVVAQLANRLKAQGRTLVDQLDDLAREHGLFLTDQLSVRFEDLSRIGETMARLRSAPPRTLAGAPVVTVIDLSEGTDELPPTDGVALLTDDDTRVVVRPSGTEPKVKCYLEVVRPVDPGATFEQVGETRAVAQDALATLKQEVAAALGL